MKFGICHCLQKNCQNLKDSEDVEHDSKNLAGFGYTEENRGWHWIYF